YCFTKDNGAIGSWHSGEMIYAYGNIPADSGVYDEGDRRLMNVFNAYFLNFIKTGDPNGEGLPRFEQNGDSLSYLELGENIAPVKEKDRKAGLFAILVKIQNN
ncbi:MAG: carboxylesterase family protein, partial [Clostridia bacterium]|nr:carboxylesterase family protein [Clostridia bacterium]